MDVRQSAALQGPAHKREDSTVPATPPDLGDTLAGLRRCLDALERVVAADASDIVSADAAETLRAAVRILERHPALVCAASGS